LSLFKQLTELQYKFASNVQQTAIHQLRLWTD